MQHNYLLDMKKYKSGNRYSIYLDETWSDVYVTRDDGWVLLLKNFGQKQHQLEDNALQ